jgi:3',5'-cyclic AMP phosphodiesterase CpdA
MAGMTSFTFAHLTDPHLTSLAGFRPGLDKRLLGFLSWRQRRRHIHRRDILDAVTADALAAAPDHVAVTGDLVHIGLPREHDEAVPWLRRLGDSERVSLAPGNHDFYAADSAASTRRAWQPWLPEADAWPRVRRCGPFAFIAVNSGTPTGPAFAAGAIDGSQASRLADALVTHADRLRVLLIHHSPLAGSHPPRKALRHAGHLRTLLARHGCELVLHGHAHRALFGEVPTPDGPASVIGAPSASASHPDPDRAAGCHVFRYDGGSTLVLTRRAWTPQGMVTREEHVLVLPRRP